MKNLTIAGRIGKDAVTRNTKGGDSVTSFSVAVDRYKKDDGPLWVNVSIWGTRGEKLEQYLTKGKSVAISGEMDLQTYENKDGDTVTQVVLNANQITLLGGGQKEEREPGDESENDETEETEEESSDDETKAGF